VRILLRFRTATPLGSARTGTGLITASDRCFGGCGEDDKGNWLWHEITSHPES